MKSSKWYSLTWITESVIFTKTHQVSYLYHNFHHHQQREKRTETECAEGSRDRLRKRLKELFFVKLLFRQKIFPLFPLLMSCFNCCPVHNMIYYNHGWKVPTQVTKSFSFSTSKFDLYIISWLDFRRFGFMKKSICASFHIYSVGLFRGPSLTNTHAHTALTRCVFCVRGKSCTSTCFDRYTKRRRVSWAKVQLQIFLSLEILIWGVCSRFLLSYVIANLKISALKVREGRMNNFTAANTSLRNVSLNAVSETQDELNALCCLKPSDFCCVFPFMSKGQFEDENLVFNGYSAHRNTCDMLPYSSQSFANPKFSFCSFESLP